MGDIPGHILCGPLWEKVSRQGKKGALRPAWSTDSMGGKKESRIGRRAKRSWNPWFSGPDHCKGFSFYSE